MSEKAKIDLNKIQISDEVKEQIKALAARQKVKAKNRSMVIFTEKSFESIYYCICICSLTLMVIILF